MRFGSLFAGVGGFDIGLEAAGWECGWQVEWDKNCQQTLSHHWPNVPKWLDVSDVNGAELSPVDVITFGSPCQDLSVAGKRAGIQQEGGRSNLFFEATRIIKEMRDATAGVSPRWAIWENVPGAFTSGKGDDFEAVLKEMANLGASLLEWATLDAQFFGVPQRRRRVFVLACFNTAISDRGGRPILAISESGRRNTSKGKPTRENVATETPASLGTSSWAAGTTVDGDVLRTSVTSKWSKGTSGPSGSEYYNLVVDNPIIFSHTQGLDAQPSEIASPTLRVGGAGMAVAEPFTASSHAGYSDGIGTLRSSGGDLGGGSETLLVHSNTEIIKVSGINT
jgi:DNA (cytosine-5)-methyltransferase 1